MSEIRRSVDNETASPAAANVTAPMSNLARYEASHYSMGTIFSITAYGASLLGLQNATEGAFCEIDRLNAVMSHYRPDSELSMINSTAFGQRVEVTPELFGLLQRSMQMSEETAGTFDITVGPLMKAWGFFHGEERLPSPSELHNLLRRTGFRHVQLHAASRTIEFDEPGVELDLGAIGKGYAVDCAVRVLRKAGISVALISAGTSSIYALGAPPGPQGWQISVCHPRDSRKQACLLRLRDLSVSISGTHEKAFALGGKIYAHILNPRKGNPADDVLMCAVIAASTTESDALSTSFFAGGLALGQSYLESHHDLATIFYLPDDSPSSFKQVMLQSKISQLPDKLELSIL
jgi:thiamine biosynthesis lipoprotein